MADQRVDSVVCDGSGPCATSTINFVGDVIRELLSQAEKMADKAEAAIAEMAKNADSAFDIVASLGPYKADTDGVPQTFNPYPGPAATEPDFSDLVPEQPDIPDPTEPLLSACEYDALFNRAKAKITKENRAATNEAYYASGNRGIGMTDPMLNTRLRQADYENRGRSTEAALEQTVTEANNRRQDRKDLYQISASSYQSSAAGAAAYLNAETQRFVARMEKEKTYLQSEAERRGWSEVQLKVILEKADKQSYYMVEQAKLLVEALDTVDQSIAQMFATMSQGLTSAANVSLRGDGGYSGSTSENFNYSGELVS